MSTRKSAQATTTTKTQIRQNFRFRKTLNTGNKLLTVKEKFDFLSSHPLAKALMRGKGRDKCGSKGSLDKVLSLAIPIFITSNH